MSSLLNFVQKSRFLNTAFTSFVKWYPEAAGYRRLGLVYDDVIADENPVVREALRRLPEKVADARTFRIRRAFQLSLMHEILPKDKWVTAEEDKHYLLPIIKEVEAEFAERETFDSLKTH